MEVIDAKDFNGILLSFKGEGGPGACRSLATARE
jgi:hypothetical protein